MSSQKLLLFYILNIGHPQGGFLKCSKDGIRIRPDTAVRNQVTKGPHL